MREKRFILTLCGTSVLTNIARNQEERKLIRKCTNVKDKGDIPKKDREELERLLNYSKHKLSEADGFEATKMSAELNALNKLCSGFPKNRQDIHMLLCSDTWLGHEVAKGLSRWINTQLATEAINIQRQTDLQTQDVELFQNSLKDLIKKLYEELPSYSGSGHKVIFNLTGGFKPVQGFLQSIAHFFADECVYIFESSSVLLTMPRLPVELATPNSIKKHINFFRNIDLQPKNPIPSDIPDTLLLVSGRECTLSAWGDLIWNEAKKALYNERILDSPNENKIRYGKQFRRDINGIEQDRIFILNNRLDQLNRYLYDKKNLCSLDFKKLRGNPTPPSTHEFDAWADGAAYRVFGHFETDTFVLDKLAKGLH